MRAQHSLNFGTFHSHGMDMTHCGISHGRVVDGARAVITNNGNATVRRQVVETGVVLGLLTELMVVFVSMGW